MTQLLVLSRKSRGGLEKKERFFVSPIQPDLSPFVVLIMCQSRITEVLNSAIMPAQKRDAYKKLITLELANMILYEEVKKKEKNH